MDAPSVELLHGEVLTIEPHDCSLAIVKEGHSDGESFSQIEAERHDHGCIVNLCHHPDVWLHILSQVSLRDIGGIPRVCRTLNESPPFSDPWLPFWRSLLADRAPGAAHMRATWHSVRPGSELAVWQAGLQARGLCGKTLELAREPWKGALKSVLALQFSLPPTSPAPHDWIRPEMFNAGLHELSLGLISIAGLLLTIPGAAPAASTRQSKVSVNDSEWGRFPRGSSGLSHDDSCALADMIAWTYSVAHGLAAHHYVNQHVLSSMLVALTKLQVVPALLTLLPDLLPNHSCSCPPPHTSSEPPGSADQTKHCPRCRAAHARTTLRTAASRLKAVGIAFSASLSYLDLFHATRTSKPSVLNRFFDTAIAALKRGGGASSCDHATTTIPRPPLCRCPTPREVEAREQRGAEEEEAAAANKGLKHVIGEEGERRRRALRNEPKPYHGEDGVGSSSRQSEGCGAEESGPLEMQGEGGSGGGGLALLSLRELLRVVAERMDLPGHRVRVGLTTCYSTAWESTAFDNAFSSAANLVALEIERRGEEQPLSADAEAAVSTRGPLKRPPSIPGTPAAVREVPPDAAEILVWCPSEGRTKRARMPAVCVHDSALLFRTAEAVAAASQAGLCTWPSADSAHTQGEQTSNMASDTKSGRSSDVSAASSADDREFLPFLKLQVHFPPLARASALHTFVSSLAASLLPPSEVPLDLIDPLPPPPTRVPSQQPDQASGDTPSALARDSLPPGLPPPQNLPRRNSSAITTPLLGSSRRGSGNTPNEAGWEEVIGIAQNFFGIERLLRRKSLLANYGVRRLERRRSGGLDTSMRVLFGLESEEKSEDEVPWE